MSVCRNCRRVIDGEKVGGFYAGPFLFCSPMCRYTSEALRKFRDESARGCSEDRLRESPAANCGIPNCHVCSGAMRSRAGKGDDT